jgi:hypothetical protein
VTARNRVLGYLAQRMSSEFNQGHQARAQDFNVLLNVVERMTDDEYEGKGERDAVPA